MTAHPGVCTTEKTQVFSVVIGTSLHLEQCVSHMGGSTAKDRIDRPVEKDEDSDLKEFGNVRKEQRAYMFTSMHASGPRVLHTDDVSARLLDIACSIKVHEVDSAHMIRVELFHNRKANVGNERSIFLLALLHLLCAVVDLQYL